MACKNFICENFFNLKVDIFFVTFNKLNILLALSLDLHRSELFSSFLFRLPFSFQTFLHPPFKNFLSNPETLVVDIIMNKDNSKE